MKYKDILVKGLQIICQLKAFHWQTKDNAQHELFGKLYEDFDQENDQLMQVMMGSINKIIGVGAGQIKIDNINATNPQQYLEKCAQFYEEVSTFLNGQSQNNIQPISDILFDIVNLFRKSLYLVRQQSKMKQGTILNQMKRPNEQLLVDLLNQYKSSILSGEVLKENTFHQNPHAHQWQIMVTNKVKKSLESSMNQKLTILPATPLNQTQISTFTKYASKPGIRIDTTPNKRYPFTGGRYVVTSGNGRDAENVADIVHMQINQYSLFFLNTDVPYGIDYKLIFIGYPDGKVVEKFNRI